MKENYLHDRIRKLDDKIEELTNRINNMEISVNKACKTKEDINQEFLSALKYFRNNSIRADIIKVSTEIFSKNSREFYSKLHKQIEGEMTGSIKSMKNYSEQFVRELMLSRRDLSIIMNIFLEKKIVTDLELIKHENIVNKLINKSNFKEDIESQFIAKVQKGKPIKEGDS